MCTAAVWYIQAVRGVQEVVTRVLKEVEAASTNSTAAPGKGSLDSLKLVSGSLRASTELS